MLNEEKAQEFIEVSDQLSHLLDQETALLRQHQLADVSTLQESKAALSQVYAGLSAELHEQLQMNADQLTEPLRSQIKQKTEQFQAAAQENKNWLSAALKVNQRVIEAVAQVVLEADANPDIYVGDGTMNDGKKNATVHMSLNQLA